MSETNFCQSCGMPFAGEETRGTNRDQSKSGQYCAYCYKDGEFLSSYESIAGYCMAHPENWGEELTPEQAKVQIEAFLSTLKRWRNA